MCCEDLLSYYDAEDDRFDDYVAYKWAKAFLGPYNPLAEAASNSDRLGMLGGRQNMDAESSYVL